MLRAPLAPGEHLHVKQSPLPSLPPALPRFLHLVSICFTDQAIRMVIKLKKRPSYLLLGWNYLSSEIMKYKGWGTVQSMGRVCALSIQQALG